MNGNADRIAEIKRINQRLKEIEDRILSELGY